MLWEEPKVLAGSPQEKACKGVYLRSWAREAILLSANGHRHHAWISLRTPTLGFGASSTADE